MNVSGYMRQSKSFKQIAALIADANTIAICAHTSPDGDAIGSGLALAEIIDSVWPGKRVTNLLADPDPVPRIYRFLPGADRFVHVEDYQVDPDLFICVDLSARSRLADAEAVCNRAKRVAVIDHHPSSDPESWDAGVVRPSAAATGVLVAQFCLSVGHELTPTVAQNLLCAVMTDTGRFQYQNADGEAFEIASMLVEAGANPSDVALHVYQSDRLAYVHLAALVMSRMTTFCNGKIAYSYATSEDIAKAGVTLDELDGLIDLVRCIDGTEVALFLKEVDDGKVRGNLRAKTDHDISGIAAELGGGGHAAAAGFTVKGTVDGVLGVVLPKLEALFDDHADAGSNDSQPAPVKRGAVR